ncbi:MAG: 2-octaprenyl-6-methoxyphenyl hydroxylase [Chromatiales bacterium]|nr:2-octaprenyl-6-methoxyphenyl hydroxylase [Chromatiales bacterium]
MRKHYDILIVGGGMVGATLAAALADTGLAIGMLEARPFGVPGEAPPSPSFDDRSIALSWGSHRILRGAGLWEALCDEVAPIRHIHVSDRGHFGAARIDHAEEGVEALGYVIENRVMGRVLMQALAERPNVELIAPATLVDFDNAESGVTAEVDCDGEPRRLSANLLVAADGTGSPVRRRLGINAVTEDYGQAALIANVGVSAPHRHVAYERFTDSGPLALLPMTPGPDGETRCSLVWTHRSAELARTEALDDAAFLAALQERFGYRLGRFTRVGRRASYPLALTHSTEFTRRRVAIVGNAAHTLHPVAGQGYNLALRDVALLAELVADACHAGGDIGGIEVLDAYETGRAADTRDVVRYTDALVRLFSNASFALGHARAAGLLAVDLVGPLRHWLARQNMGIRHTGPRLARGLPLEAAR